jgi:MFS family permease
VSRQFWAVWTATLINRAGGFVVIYLAVYLTAQRHFTPAVAGLTVGLYGLGGALGVTAGGQLADRWGRRPAALLSLTCTPLFTLALGVARTPAEIMVAAAALGVAAESARPSLSAIIADVVPPGDRLRAFSAYYWAINLGFSIAALVAGFAARAGYFTLFAADAATTAVAAVLIAAFVQETRPSRASGGTALGTPAARGVLRDRLFVGVVAGNLLLALVMAQASSGLPIAMARDGLSATTYGRVMAVNGLLIVACQLFVTRLLRGWAPARTLIVSTVVVGLGFALTTFAHSALWYAGTVAVWTLGEMFSSPSSQALSAALSPAALRGRYQGFFALSWQVAGFAGPALGGLVQQAAGSAALWFGCLGLTVAGSAWHLANAPARMRRTLELSSAPPGAFGPGKSTPSAERLRR